MKYVLALAVAAATLAGNPSPRRHAQAGSERVWLAGRYDSTHIIVYFGVVALHDSLPADSTAIPQPRAFGFFGPIGVSPSDIAGILKRNPGAREQFTIGDRYDLLTGGGHVVAVTLTQLVACPGDEQVGNDSYIGAIAQVSAADLALLASNDYYVVVPHQRRRRIPPAGIVDTSAAPEMRVAFSRVVRPFAGKAAPNGRLSLLETQRVRPAAADTRWFVRAIDRDSTRACTTIAAWITTQPSTRVVAADTLTCMFDFPPAPPRLLNAVALGPGRTVLIVRFEGEDSMDTSVLEYSAGRTIRQMRAMWSVSAAE